MLVYDDLERRRFFAILPSHGDARRPHSEQVMPEAVAGFRQAVRAAVPFEITNVADYMYMGTDQEIWYDEDFPKPLPPFANVWFEWKRPKTIISREVGTTHFNPQVEKMGALVHSAVIPGNRLAVFVAPWIALHGMALVLNIPYGYGVDLRPPFQTVPLDPKADREKTVSYIIAGVAPEDVHSDRVHSLCKESSAEALPYRLAISLLNSRNVETKMVRPAEALKHSQLKKGHTYSDYRVIEIQPIKTRLERETGKLGYSRQAAAIIRGHFKDYTEGKGLFGRLHGLYWWEQQGHLPPQGAHYELARASGELAPAWCRKGF